MCIRDRYMTVTVRSEEPFPSELRADLSGGLCRIGIESEGTVELQDARVLSLIHI